ncbi:DedA family protein [Verminephrobacter eiseniae]|uniref:YqaA family protein n=1 Tax=Verminephrobacter eiseniae TaxID=364317 RepID=UPI002237993A|nr:YqaA family protein [Verminephrobacter eiseniae]MCW5259185.1 DedA family protein [Verminephrobacter eiseniae]
MEIWIPQLLQWLALPQFGLSTVFVVSVISATLLPLGSEFAVFGLIKLNPALFWPTILVATAGNTLGGALNWWLGLGAHMVVDKVRGATELRALNWLKRFGAPACLLSWLPVVGDPLCAVAGWLKLPFWPCLAYMAVGKFLRYWVMTSALLYFTPEHLLVGSADSGRMWDGCIRLTQVFGGG